MRNGPEGKVVGGKQGKDLWLVYKNEFKNLIKKRIIELTRSVSMYSRSNSMECFFSFETESPNNESSCIISKTTKTMLQKF